MASSSLTANRDTILVSGYYGFDNLGDEAILEQLICELKQVAPDSRIVVLSNRPEQTSASHKVLSISRWNIPQFLQVLRRARLFISGGGGLFQDTQSLKSIVYYGGQVLAAYWSGTPILIYAQGVGPLQSEFSKLLTRYVFGKAQCLSVRDEPSAAMLTSWGLKTNRTADPVWCLGASEIPKAMATQIDRAQLSPELLKVGISLRDSSHISKEKMAEVFSFLVVSLPRNSVLIPLPLHPAQDKIILNDLAVYLEDAGHKVLRLDFGALTMPSQWLSFFHRLDFVVSMRLHGLIMALRAGVPVFGLAYDPKVANLMIEYEQPFVDLGAQQGGSEVWLKIMETALADRDRLAGNATAHAVTAHDLACKNFDLLATMLANYRTETASMEKGTL